MTLILTNQFLSAIIAVGIVFFALYQLRPKGQQSTPKLLINSDGKEEAPFVDAKPFVSVGERVTKGQKLCIIEAMKVMNEITSPCDGILKEILVKEGQMVEFGAKLFAIGE